MAKSEDDILREKNIKTLEKFFFFKEQEKVDWAKLFTDDAVCVVIAARKIDRCVAMCKTLENKKVQTLPIDCDVSKIEDCQNLVEAMISKA